MSRRDLGPHVRMYQGPLMTHLPTSSYESLTHALQSGAEWWEGETLYGSAFLVRLSSITDVRYMNAEGIAAERDDEQDVPWGVP